MTYMEAVDIAYLQTGRTNSRESTEFAKAVNPSNTAFMHGTIKPGEELATIEIIKMMLDRLDKASLGQLLAGVAHNYQQGVKEANKN
jgi:uncharacterized protein involved in propanediol utilization